jgi:soluble lytic murein transglycosylase-like protein
MRLLCLLLVFATPQLGLGATGRSKTEWYVEHYAAHYRVPPELIAALIDVESRWNPNALSNKGAMGLMQLMPATARRFGAFQPFDEEQNIAAGTRYVTTLMWEFRGDVQLVAAAFLRGCWTMLPSLPLSAESEQYTRPERGRSWVHWVARR